MSTFYLSGAIHAPKDGGVGWRKIVAKALVKAGHTVLDPTKKYHGSPGRSTRRLRALRKKGGWSEFCAEAEMVMDADMLAVKRSDALVAYVPKLEGVCGTICEIYRAWALRKPVYLIHEVDYPDVNDWLMCMVLTTDKGSVPRPEERVFKTIGDLLSAIEKGRIT